MKRVLLASPYKKAGGIARWTGHILSFWQSLESKTVSLNLLPLPDPMFKGLIKGKLKRILDGIHTYSRYIINEHKYLRSKEYDILHICSSASFGLFKDYLMIKVASHYNIPSVVHFRFGRIPELVEQKNWEYKMLMKVIRLSTKSIIIDLKSFDVLKSEGVDNIVYIPNPISPSVLSIVDSKKEERERNVILFVGHCTRAKGVFELIDACRNMTGVKVVFVGSLIPEVKQQMEDYAAADIEMEIKGELPYEQIIEMMKKCAVFVLPTYTEGFPNVILESMACACPIVTTDVGAIPEMLDINNGFNCGICVKPMDVESLREGILKMLNDHEYAYNCGINAHRRVIEKYSMPTIWKALEEMWSNL